MELQKLQGLIDSGMAWRLEGEARNEGLDRVRGGAGMGAGVSWLERVMAGTSLSWAGGGA